MESRARREKGTKLLLAKFVFKIQQPNFKFDVVIPRGGKLSRGERVRYTPEPALSHQKTIRKVISILCL